MKRLKQNRPPPVWVAVRTMRRVTRSPRQRNWRVNKLKL